MNWIRKKAVDLPRNLGLTLLCLWLILTGVFSLLNVSFTGMRSAMAILAIAAGVLLWLERQ